MKELELNPRQCPFSNKTDWTLRDVYEEDHALLELTFRARMKQAGKEKTVTLVLQPGDNVARKFKDAFGNAEGILSPEWTHRHYVQDDEYIPHGEDIEAFLKREIAKSIIRWEDSPQLGYEILPNKYFYRYQAPTPTKDLPAEFWRLEKEGETMLEGLKTKPSTALARGPAAARAQRPARTLLADVRGLILQARASVARTVDAGLVTLYWHVGRRIRQDILHEKRGDYGQRIVAALGRQLEREFGRGFGEKNLWRMIQFAEVFPDEAIVASLRRELGWTHFKAIIPISDPLKRDFYAEMCRIEKWNTRTLGRKIGSMLFERTALSRKPDKLIRKELTALRKEDRLTPDLVFRDPYLLDFLGLKDTYAEKDLEAAILREMESFILELGVGFCFVARQKRMQVDDDDYYLDLLFYHRKLRRLVAIDLKMRNFEAGDKGQMELYLNWLKRHECEPDEAEPLGIILCAGKRSQHVELLEVAKSGIHVASYGTKVLPKRLLERKLHDAVRLARARLAAAKG